MNFRQFLPFLLIILILIAIFAINGEAKRRKRNNNKNPNNQNNKNVNNKNGQNGNKNNKNEEAIKMKENKNANAAKIKEKNSGIAASASDLEFPTAETHRWFKECAVKLRIDPNKNSSFELHTLFAHSKMDRKSGLFFDLSPKFNGYVADSSLLETCEEDREASRPNAKKIIGAKCEGEKKIRLMLPGDKSIRIGTGCKGIDNMAQNGKKYFPQYRLYSCDWDICDGIKYILVERPGQYDLRQIYYIDPKIKTNFGCLQNKICPSPQKMEELHIKNLRDTKTKAKTRKHKLFVECAVEKKKNGKTENIETLVKNIPLNENQILFFGKGANIYIGNRTQEMRETCEKDKEANMVLPISNAQLNLNAKGRLVFNYTAEGGAFQSEVLDLELRGTGQNKHCAAMTRVGAFNVLFCPLQVCGKHKLIFMRKTKNKRNSQKKSLMDIKGEKVNVDHIYIVKMKKVKEKALEFMRQRCKETLPIVEGVSKTAGQSFSNAAAGGNEVKKSKNQRKRERRKNKKLNANAKADENEKDENTKMDENEKEDGNDEVKKSKNQLKRERRKNRKIANANANEKEKADENEKDEDGRKDKEDGNGNDEVKKSKSQLKRERRKNRKNANAAKTNEDEKGNAGNDEDKGMENAVCTRDGRCGRGPSKQQKNKMNAQNAQQQNAKQNANAVGGQVGALKKKRKRNRNKNKQNAQQNNNNNKENEKNEGIEVKKVPQHKSEEKKTNNELKHENSKDKKEDVKKGSSAAADVVSHKDMFSAAAIKPKPKSTDEEKTKTTDEEKSKKVEGLSKTVGGRSGSKDTNALPKNHYL